MQGVMGLYVRYPRTHVEDAVPFCINIMVHGLVVESERCVSVTVLEVFLFPCTT
jgi:hypothetical protein